MAHVVAQDLEIAFDICIRHKQLFTLRFITTIKEHCITHHRIEMQDETAFIEL